VSRLLVVASDPVGSTMAGPGIRSLWFARELARRGHAVTLAVPFGTDLRERGLDVVVDNPWHARRMTELARAHDAVVAQRLPLPTMLALARSRTRAVYDLYAPVTIEDAALRRARDGAAEALDHLTMRVALETGDAFVCASERQRDLWLGALAAVGRVEPARYRRDPSFGGLVGVVPFGVDPEPPQADGAVVKGVVPGIAAGDRVALWGGGIWNWLDPLTVIRAIAQLDRPDVKLLFLGTRHPNPGVPAMAMHARAVELADGLGLLGSRVFFNEGWVPYAERGAYFLEADVGVSAHLDELEARFAFRTRLVDCIWAGLPIVATEGDALGELARERGLGEAVPAGDAGAYAGALGRVLDAGRNAFSQALAGARDELAWPRVVDRLAALLDGGKADLPGGAATHAARAAEYAALRARHTLATRGVRGTVARAAQAVTLKGQAPPRQNP
jgi:hypothetical protein